MATKKETTRVTLNVGLYYADLEVVDGVVAPAVYLHKGESYFDQVRTYHMDELRDLIEVAYAALEYIESFEE